MNGSASSSSSPSKKIKVEKTEDTNEKPVTPPMRECEFCGKKFSSGKALGGHKRFHFQLLRKERESANKLAVTGDNYGGGDDRGSNIKLLSSLNSPNKKLLCYLCNKEFLSEKSLFGHMRSHPGREWKGIHPPNDDDNGLMEPVAVSPITSSSSPSIDISKSLPPSWLKTGIRGKKGIFDEILEGVVAVMDDKSHENNKSSSDLQNRGKIEHDYGDREKEKEGDLVKEGCNLKKKKRILSNNMNDEITTNKKNTKLIVRLKTRPQYEEDNVAEDEKGFQCNICDEYFATIQSLRGHRSNHNKEKKSKSHKNDGDDNEQIRYLENTTEESSEPSSKILREFDLNELPENNNIEDGGS
ncbi:zinc finger protein ZAT2-like [Arachis stenosperma]|uniref:zinc finger protein ZAT2-like n=1 Tax=Arachis stenosperma TaxID=217475 RepID=UPI0025ACEF88|nr:zinc finger protein ZAT2-like [Arachis stenosperma]